MRNVDTFFRGYRRETIIDGASILCNPAGEKRLKLSMRIPLSGDQLVGMPGWVGEPFVTISKDGVAGKHWASEVELEPMLLHVFALPQSEKEVFTFDAVLMKGFKIERDADSELILSFTAYIPRTGKSLKFADDNFNASIFVRYEAAQMLLDDNPNIQPIDEPRTGNGGDDEDDAEKEPEPEPEPGQEETVQNPPVELPTARSEGLHTLGSARLRKSDATAQEQLLQ